MEILLRKLIKAVISIGALVIHKSIASPYTRAKPSVQGIPLEILILNYIGNYIVASGKTRRHSNNLRDWAILSSIPKP
jgi:hypothetical protein